MRKIQEKTLRIIELTDWPKYTSNHTDWATTDNSQIKSEWWRYVKKWTNDWIYKWCNDEFSPNLVRGIKFVKLYEKGKKPNKDYEEKNTHDHAGIICMQAFISLCVDNFYWEPITGDPYEPKNWGQLTASIIDVK